MQPEPVQGQPQELDAGPQRFGGLAQASAEQAGALRGEVGWFHHGGVTLATPTDIDASAQVRMGVELRLLGDDGAEQPWDGKWMGFDEVRP